MKFLIRYYKNLVPEEDEMVLGKVIKYTEYGIDVYLPEYQQTAYLNFKDAAGTRRLKRIKKKVQINKEYPFTVSKVDEKQEDEGVRYNIDLTKKYQTDDENENFIKKYKKYRACIEIMKSFFRKLKLENGSQQEEYMDKTIWKYDKYKTYTNLKLIKSNKELLNKFDLTDNEKISMLECIIAGISDVTYSVRFNIKINSLDIYGKNCIVAFLELLEKTFSKKPYVKSIPIYVLEFRNVNEYKLETFKLETKKSIDSLEKDKVMVSLETIEEFEE